MIACGLRARIASGEIVWPTSSEYTRHSRTRRAISCAYWPPKSRTSTGRSSATGNSTTFASSETDGSAAIVRRLFRDRHVVRMRLSETGARDSDEARLLHVLDRRGAAVAHGRREAADELVGDRAHRAFVADAAFDPFRDELVDVLDVALEIAVLRERPRAHGAERPHAAVFLESLPLDEDDLARRLVGACEERAEHDRVRTRGDRLRNVAGSREAA